MLDHQQSHITCQPIAPEDISIGVHIIVLHQMHEYPSFYWCGVDATVLAPDQPVRITWLPFTPEPLRVRSICLPYILVKTPDGDRELLDVRRASLALIPEPLGRTIYAQLKPREKRRKKNRKR